MGKSRFPAILPQPPGLPRAPLSGVSVDCLHHGKMPDLHPKGASQQEAGLGRDEATGLQGRPGEDRGGVVVLLPSEVMTNIANWKDPPFLILKSHYFYGHFP